VTYVRSGKKVAKQASKNLDLKEGNFFPSWFRFALLDLIVANIGLLIAVAFVGIDTKSILLFSGFVLSYIPWFAKDKLYISRFNTRRTDEFRRLVNSISKATTGLIVVVYLLNLDLNRTLLISVVCINLVLLVLEREIVRRWFQKKRRGGTLQRKVVLVGGNDEGSSIAEMIESHKYLGYKVVEKVDLSLAQDPNELTTIVLSSARLNNADSVIVAASAIDMKSSNRLVRDLVEAGIHVELSSTLADIAPDRLTVRTLGKFPIIYIEPRHRSGWRHMAKRTFDLTISGLAILCISPILLGIALIIKATSRGPVLFKQERVGKDAEPFNVFKFRTMVVDAEDLLKNLDGINEGAGPLFKMKDDPRVTGIGKFLRKTSLDELPQLFNVLKNEMSLVGPRPALQSEMQDWEFDLYGRLRVKPGITGMWQVSGRSSTTFEQYTRLDLYYVDNWSLLIDLSILIKTIPAVLKSEGAY